MNVGGVEAYHAHLSQFEMLSLVDGTFVVKLLRDNDESSLSECRYDIFHRVYCAKAIAVEQYPFCRNAAFHQGVTHGRSLVYAIKTMRGTADNQCVNLSCLIEGRCSIDAVSEKQILCVPVS